MKNILVICVLMLMLSSCASSTFYAYENVEDEVYCTIEVDRKGYSTYRGIRYPKYSNWPYKRFLYMKSDEENLEGYLRDYLQLKGIFDIHYIEEQKGGGDTGFDIALLFYKSDSCIMYNDISYVVEKDSAYYCCSDCILEHPDFLKANSDGTWMPPYFKKVDKIDYSKFSVFRVKKRFLKNPKKKNAPKSRWRE